jgi:glycosyltransferase involved in cell wall biosynthesis
MRICHVCSGHRDDDARVFERECASLAETGYDVHLLANSSMRHSYSRQGVTVHPVPQFSTRRERLLGRRRIAESASALCPDIYHVHEPELLGAVLACARGKPVIWDVHEIYVDEIRAKPWIPKPLRPLVGVIWDRMERSMVRQCAAVVAATEWLAPRYRKLHDRVVVLNNFPRLPDKVDSVSLVRRENALVFTGTIAPNRGVLETIQAMAILKRKAMVVTLDLAGTPNTREYLNELMQEAEHLGVRANITLHGHLTLGRTRSLQQTCGIGMVAHLMSEGNLVGCPVKLYEFMMFGLPLVYSDIPVFVSVAGESDAGISVIPGHPEQIAVAIESLLLNPAMARRFGENGRNAIYERFNWNHEWPKLRDLYLQLVGPPRGSHPGREKGRALCAE